MMAFFVLSSGWKQEEEEERRRRSCYYWLHFPVAGDFSDTKTSSTSNNKDNRGNTEIAFIIHQWILRNGALVHAVELLLPGLTPPLPYYRITGFSPFPFFCNGFNSVVGFGYNGIAFFIFFTVGGRVYNGGSFCRANPAVWMITPSAAILCRQWSVFLIMIFPRRWSGSPPCIFSLALKEV